MHLNDAKVYGDTVVAKEECINHIAKRMYSRLERFAQRSKAAGKPVGGAGKGKLTKKRMQTWSSYYRNALSNYAGNVPAMQHGVWAILYHSMSTEDTPKHHAGGRFMVLLQQSGRRR